MLLITTTPGTTRPLLVNLPIPLHQTSLIMQLATLAVFVRLKKASQLLRNIIKLLPQKFSNRKQPKEQSASLFYLICLISKPKRGGRNPKKGVPNPETPLPAATVVGLFFSGWGRSGTNPKCKLCGKDFWLNFSSPVF